jgi:hypothetical protein
MYSNSERDMGTNRKRDRIEMKIAREMSIWIKTHMRRRIVAGSTFFITKVLIRWSMSASTVGIGLGCSDRSRIFLSDSSDS